MKISINLKKAPRQGDGGGRTSLHITTFMCENKRTFLVFTNYRIYIYAHCTVASPGFYYFCVQQFTYSTVIIAFPASFLFFCFLFLCHGIPYRQDGIPRNSKTNIVKRRCGGLGVVFLPLGRPARVPISA